MVPKAWSANARARARDAAQKMRIREIVLMSLETPPHAHAGGVSGSRRAESTSSPRLPCVKGR